MLGNVRPISVCQGARDCPFLVEAWELQQAALSVVRNKLTGLLDNQKKRVLEDLLKSL